MNRTYRRSGSLWEGRFQLCLVNAEDYIPGCYRYIELNPVRAGMVAHPADYRWSSYQANARGKTQKLLDVHESYRALGNCPKVCQNIYRELFSHQLKTGMVDEIRQATNGNYVLGADRFRQQIGAAIGRQVSLRGQKETGVNVVCPPFPGLSPFSQGEPMIRVLGIISLVGFLASCAEDHHGVSASLINQLASTEVSCDFLQNSKYSKGYWVRNELDGWGLLIVSKNNEPNSYTLGLMAYGHEMALETRVIECE